MKEEKFKNGNTEQIQELEQLNIRKVDLCDFEYILKDSKDIEKGRIVAKYYGTNFDYLYLDRFCVAVKYRSTEDKISKGKYGRKLLNAVIQEAKKNPNIKKIIVEPKGEELYDNIEPMKTELLCVKYQYLGFRYVDENIKKMVLWL